MKPKTPIQVLGKSLSRSFNKFIATKDDIINKVLSNSTKLNPDQFMKAIENFTDSQWKSLIQSINDRIRLRENQPFKVARKKARKLAREERAKREEEKAKQTALKEEAAEEELLKIISEDEYLKNHNIAIVEIVNVFEDEYVVKVYLICGGYFIEGTIKEIISTIRRELKKNKVTVRIFCPACSSKNLRFCESCCLCNDCGTLSEPETDTIIKQYDPADKDFWWAQSLADITHYLSSQSGN